MSESLFSPSWYRVADLRPKLRDHTATHRHTYRRQTWYILEDQSTGRHHWFNQRAFQLIGLLNGERDIASIWEALNTKLGDDAPTQDDVIELLGRLHASDTLVCDVPPDTEELFRRQQKHQRAVWTRKLMSPLSQRFPLVDPERVLNKLIPYVRWTFATPALLLWIAIVLTATGLAFANFDALTSNFSERVLTPQNLLLLSLVYPLIKLAHELGHAFATKAWGGQVHEMGLTLLVLVPVPYVDASAATAFTSKYKRIVVSAAGMMVELLFASIAVVIWINVEPGLARALAFDVILIACISTLLVNGNPLLRFDGYYILADAIEIPNLGSRSNQYLLYLIKRYAFGMQNVRSPVVSTGERRWFIAYGLAAFVYKLVITLSIALFIAGKFFVVGVLLAVWAVAVQLIVPLCKGLMFLLTNAGLRPVRTRAITVCITLLMVTAVATLALPVPYWTRTEGVVWLPEGAQIRAAAAGEITTMHVRPEAYVERHGALFDTSDPFLDAELAVLTARRTELHARYDAVSYTNRAEADLLSEEIEALEAELTQVEERRRGLRVQSPGTGTFIAPHHDRLKGRFLRQGDLVGYVADLSNANIRVIVKQQDLDIVRSQTRSVQIALASNIDASVPARVIREVPGAMDVLPSAVLGTTGGGSVAVDPADESGTQALEQVFQLDLEPLRSLPSVRYGERVHVRFDHGTASLAKQWYRAASQLLLKHFGV